MGALIRFTGHRLLLQRGADLLMLGFQCTSSVGHLMFASAAGFASEAIKGINILKSGSDPEVRPDEQYPQWVWQVGSPGKMLSQLNREQEDPEQETTMEEVICNRA